MVSLRLRAEVRGLVVIHGSRAPRRMLYLYRTERKNKEDFGRTNGASLDLNKQADIALVEETELYELPLKSIVYRKI